MSLVLLAAVLAVGGTASRYSDAAPPERFQRPATVSLDIRDQAGIEEACQPRYGVPPTGMKTYACTIGQRIVIPNPCAYPSSDTYAHMLCHELGHANGWPSTHGG